MFPGAARGKFRVANKPYCEAQAPDTTKDRAVAVVLSLHWQPPFIG